jgi:ribosome-associated heat shock protein Hsp15
MAVEKVRIDKWLWSVRIFKSRTLATDACKAGKIKINELTVKPSLQLQGEELIEVKKNGFNFQFKVVTLLKNRVGAPEAQKCYINQTSEEELNKYNDWFVGKGRIEMRERGAGRPTKKERREIDAFKDFVFDFDDME